jgi:hypothetical protein
MRWKWIVGIIAMIMLILLLNPPYRMVQSGDTAYIYNVYTGRAWEVRDKTIWTTEYRISEEWEQVYIEGNAIRPSHYEWRKKSKGLRNVEKLIENLE